MGTVVNKDAIGSKVSIISNLGTQIAFVNTGGSYLSSNDKRIIFGLGKDERVDSIEIEWSDGQLQTLTPLDINQYHRIVQGD